MAHARRSLTPPSLTPPSYRRKMMVNPGIPLPTWSRLHEQCLKGGSTSTYYTDSEDEGSHTPTKCRTRSDTSLRYVQFNFFWLKSFCNGGSTWTNFGPSLTQGPISFILLQ